LAVVCAACDHSNPPGARFCGGCGAALGTPRSAAAAAPAPAQAVERRQLTVMFCDLVGSTPLAAQLDPEDLRDVIRSFHHCCAGVIAQHEVIHRGRPACDYIRGWLHYCLEAYLRLSRRRPDWFGAAAPAGRA
jgi:hypothetical protein